MKELEYMGIWWLPENPDEKIEGTLEFSRSEGGRLKLFSYFSKSSDTHKLMDGVNIILGFSISPEEKYITLYNCFEISRNYSMGLVNPASTFFANQVMVGTHFQTEEDIRFKNVSVDFPHLAEWVGVSGFDIERNYEKRKTKVEYEFPESINCGTINEEYKIGIDFRLKSKYDILPTDAGMKQETYFYIEADQEKPLDDFEEIIYYLGAFLSLAFDKPVNHQTVKGRTITGDLVQVYSPFMDEYDYSKRLDDHNMRFTYDDIKEKDSITKWFDKLDILKPIYNLYATILSKSTRFQDHRFLNLVQALEAYHRFTQDNKEFIKEEKEKIKIILNNTPQYNDWLKGKLNYAYELSLRQRLKELYDKYSDILSDFIKKKDFIDKVVTTRNYLTHFDKKLKDKAVTGIKLYDLNKELRRMLSLCLFEEIGFDKEELRAIFSDTTNYLLKNPKMKKRLLDAKKHSDTVSSEVVREKLRI